jgi:hypothetical protein
VLKRALVDGVSEDHNQRILLAGPRLLIQWPSYSIWRMRSRLNGSTLSKELADGRLVEPQAVVTQRSRAPD